MTYFYDDRKEAIYSVKETFYQIQEEKTSPEKEAIPDIAFAKFSYYIYDEAMRVYAWVKEWSRGIPIAVKLELAFGKDEKLSNYIKTINIPVAKIEFKEETEGI